MDFLDFNTENNNLMIVDSLNLAFRFKHANKKEFAEEFWKTVKSLARSYNAKDIVLASDFGSSWRKKIYPDYKNNRKKLREEQTEEERLEFEQFLEEVDRCLSLGERHGALVFKFPGVEADDIAALLVAEYSDFYEHTWLISTDADWDLLVRENVSRFSYRTRKEITLDNWPYIYDQEEHLSIKVLQGDKGDSIPGVEGIGEKRAYKLLRDYGPTALDVAEAVPIPGNQKFIQNLNNFGMDNIIRNYQLISLLDFYEDALIDYANSIREVMNENCS